VSPNLRIPGPTPCPPETLAEMSRQMINHRGPEFAEMQTRIMGRLKVFFRTENEVYVLTTSGTGAMEAAIVNVLSPGDHIMAVSVGEFGERFVEISEAFGARVTKLSFEPGTAADPEIVAAELKKDPSAVAVLVTHNETSTGVTNDIAAISRAVRAAKPDVLLIVDAISSLGCLPFATDAWGIDVAVTASQKGFMIPPVPHCPTTILLENSSPPRRTPGTPPSPSATGPSPPAAWRSSPLPTNTSSPAT